MPLSLLLSLLPAMFGMMALGPRDEVRTLVVEQEVVMRIPVRPAPAIEWEEHKGPRCIPAKSIRGAMLSGREHVDFVLYDRTRLRASLSENCPALDFYNGFYLTPDDGQVCIKRDTIHSRMGSSCRIERFRRLEPKIAR